MSHSFGSKVTFYDVKRHFCTSKHPIDSSILLETPLGGWAEARRLLRRLLPATAPPEALLSLPAATPAAAPLRLLRPHAAAPGAVLRPPGYLPAAASCGSPGGGAAGLREASTWKSGGQGQALQSVRQILQSVRQTLQSVRQTLQSVRQTLHFVSFPLSSSPKTVNGL